MNVDTTPALPAARVLLRVLIVLNWLYGLAVLALLVTTFANPAWALRAIAGYHGDAAGRLLPLLQLVAAVGVACVPINDVVLRRLRDIVDTVRAGNAFARDNAGRLRSIGTALLVLQMAGGVIGLIGRAASVPGHPVHLDAGFSAAGWLAVLMSFVLAHVFAEGNRLREDAEGVV